MFSRVMIYVVSIYGTSDDVTCPRISLYTFLGGVSRDACIKRYLSFFGKKFLKKKFENSEAICFLSTGEPISSHRCICKS